MMSSLYKHAVILLTIKDAFIIRRTSSACNIIKIVFFRRENLNILVIRVCIGVCVYACACVRVRVCVRDRVCLCVRARLVVLYV